ncbi:MAG: hypothetical protein GY715_14780 [Planctomycetes bacterium]|nr:hypothetical protein [Planctomycetota bacterium]
MFTDRVLITASLMMILAAGGCSEDPTAQPATSQPTPAPEEPTAQVPRPAAAVPTPPPAPDATASPPTSRPAAAAPPPTAPAEAHPSLTGPVELPGLTVTPDEGWARRLPASRMRVAEFELPGADGADNATLVVFHFGASAGGIEANIDRWCGQFSQPDGTASRDRAKVEQREVNDLVVHTVDLPGTLIAETTPGSGVRRNIPDHYLLAAIVETDAGHYYLKLVGPEVTIERWRDGWDSMVESVEPASIAPGVPGHP